jgi:hypothetical protein
MEFKVASEDDVRRITNQKQEMAAENMMNIKTPSEGDARAHAGMAVPGSSDKGSIVDVDPAGNNGKGLRLGTYVASGRFAQVYTKDGGRTAVHEELHNWGLGDYYADASYQWEMVDNKTGKVEKSGTTGGTPTSYVGFEDDIMSSGNCMNQVHVDDLVNMALKTSEVKKSDNFVMARKADSGRPNGNRKVDQIPQKKEEKTATKTTTYKNPVYKNAGN